VPAVPSRIPVNRPADLDRAAIVRIAHGDLPEITDALAAGLNTRRSEMLTALAGDRPVYGVNTGLGRLSQHRLDPDSQARHQQHMMRARAVGGPPWLTSKQTRATLAVRLRTLVNGDAGVSAGLCRMLQNLLAHDLLPAIPASSTGVAGEIIPMAHLGLFLSGEGELLTGGDAGAALTAAGLAPMPWATKEGIALIQGHPVATALATLLLTDAERLYRHQILTLAADLALSGAAPDVLDPQVQRGDPILAVVAAEIRSAAGTHATSRALQPPVSFRATPQVLAHLTRTIDRLAEAVDRALNAVTDSPAFVDGDRFLGTAGFYGYDLATHLDATAVAALGAADVGAARLARWLDPAVSGLTLQLSPDPGPETGLATVHKRAIGVTHRLRRATMPSTTGPVEASGGQEDVQAFAIEAAHAARDAIEGTREVLACQLLALHQARCLGAELPADASPELSRLFDDIAAVVPSTTTDRPFGRDIEAIRALLT